MSVKRLDIGDQIGIEARRPAIEGAHAYQTSGRRTIREKMGSTFKMAIQLMFLTCAYVRFHCTKKKLANPEWRPISGILCFECSSKKFKRFGKISVLDRGSGPRR